MPCRSPRGPGAAYGEWCPRPGNVRHRGSADDHPPRDRGDRSQPCRAARAGGGTLNDELGDDGRGRTPRPRDLRGAANVARALAYVLGLVGVVAGAVVYRSGGGTAPAVVIWVITFAAGAVLMIAAFLCDGLAALLGRTAALEQELRTVTRPRDPDDEPWSGGHPNPW